MTKISAYTILQERFGKEQAQAIAEFIESQEGPDFSRYASKDDIQAVRQDLKDLEIRLLKESSKLREDMTRDNSKTREDMISRMNWSTIIQVITTVGALIALAKVF